LHRQPKIQNAFAPKYTSEIKKRFCPILFKRTITNKTDTMKRIIVNEWKVGLVFKNENFKKVLINGRYWISPFEEVILYDLTKPFFPNIDLNVLLKNEEIRKHLEVAEVLDNEIVLRYEDGIFKGVLTSGKYAFWKGIVEHRFVKVDTSSINVQKDVDRNTLQRAEVLPFLRVVSIEPANKGLLYVDGNLTEILETGDYYFWKNATKIHVIKADSRQQQMEISGQEILSLDKATIRVNFFATYKIVDFVKALNDNKEYEKQLYILLQLALREFIGSLSLDELLEKKDTIAEYVMKELKSKAEELGVELKGCGIRDVILPGDVKDIMNQVLIAQKKAQANIITRREETASTRSLLNTAKLLEENSMLYKLKEMEYVEKIADKINNITLSGGSLVVDQLKNIFISEK